MSAMNIIFPSGYRVDVSHLRQQLDQAHYAWRTEWQENKPDFKIENIRFRHVEGWNRKCFSIQSAHDANHWLWKATRVVWMIGGGRI